MWLPFPLEYAREYFMFGKMNFPECHLQCIPLFPSPSSDFLRRTDDLRISPPQIKNVALSFSAYNLVCIHRTFLFYFNQWSQLLYIKECWEPIHVFSRMRISYKIYPFPALGLLKGKSLWRKRFTISEVKWCTLWTNSSFELFKENDLPKEFLQNS